MCPQNSILQGVPTKLTIGLHLTRILQLLYAAQNGDIDKVYDLLQARADPNVKDEVRTMIIASGMVPNK